MTHPLRALSAKHQSPLAKDALRLRWSCLPPLF
jgi:hypothetical protein